MHRPAILRRQPDPAGPARQPVRGLVLLVLLAAACSHTQAVSLNSLDVQPAQREIADFHQREAAAFRQKAEEQAARMQVYEQLFGPKSDWVAGARSLMKFYEESAREQEERAEFHRGLAPGARRFSAP